jgi:hypothetical protein
MVAVFFLKKWTKVRANFFLFDSEFDFQQTSIIVQIPHPIKSREIS